MRRFAAPEGWHPDRASEPCQALAGERLTPLSAICEEAGALDTMLFKVASFYEEEVNNAVDALASLLEPFIMVLIGVIVGGMVVGMYLPIFKLAAAV